MKNAISIIMLSMFTATATFAADTCLASLTADDLIGEYTIELGPGTMTVITKKGYERVHVMPMRTGATVIALYDDVPVLYSDTIVEGGILEIPLRQAVSAEKDLSLMDDPVFPALEAGDLELVLGCSDSATLPQLLGTGTVTGGGNSVPNSVQMLVYFNDEAGINAIGVYESVVFSEATGGTIVIHTKIRISGT